MSLSRRSFIKKSSYSAAAVTILGAGVALAQNNSKTQKVPIQAILLAKKPGLEAEGEGTGEGDTKEEAQKAAAEQMIHSMHAFARSAANNPLAMPPTTGLKENFLDDIKEEEVAGEVELREIKFEIMWDTTKHQKPSFDLEEPVFEFINGKWKCTMKGKLIMHDAGTGILIHFIWNVV